MTFDIQNDGCGFVEGKCPPVLSAMPQWFDWPLLLPFHRRGGGGARRHLQRYKDERGRLEAQKQELQQRLNTAKDHNVWGPWGFGSLLYRVPETIL
jgi:hypothetical protein